MQSAAQGAVALGAAPAQPDVLPTSLQGAGTNPQQQQPQERLQAIPEAGQPKLHPQSPLRAAASAVSAGHAGAAAAVMQGAASPSQHVPAARRMLVDQRQKWQRITEWISRDSAEAAAVSNHRSSSHAESGSARATAGSSDAQSIGDPVAASRHRMRSPGMETIESVAELRYSLDTTLVDPEQHAMAQAAAAAQMAAGAAWRNHTAPAASPRAQQQQQQVAPVVHAQQALQPAEAGYQHNTGSNGYVAPAAAAVATTQAAAGAIPAIPATATAGSTATAGAGAGADGQQHVLASAAGSTHAMQQQLLQESQERHRAQQLAAQLQQQVQEMLQQQLDASRDFQQQLQQARDAAAAEVRTAQQVILPERPHASTTLHSYGCWRAHSCGSLSGVLGLWRRIPQTLPFVCDSCHLLTGNAAPADMCCCLAVGTRQ